MFELKKNKQYKQVTVQKLGIIDKKEKYLESQGSSE